MNRHNKTALITGASRGLGLALARALAAEGWSLVITARGADALEAARTELAASTTVLAIAGNVADSAHRAVLGAAVAENALDLVVNNASILGPSPQPALLDYPLDVLEAVYRANVIGPLGLLQSVRTALKPGACIINISSDAAVEPYAGWGGYGSSKAAFEQLSAILAAENPDWRVYWVDPGDMQTQMHQEAFPGEDISDRPLPETSVPGLLALIAGNAPSGRYQARAAAPAPAPIGEVRVAFTVDKYEQAVALYRDTLGLPMAEEWNTSQGRGMVLQAGPATIELLDTPQAAFVDEIEVGRRVAGPIRIALEVPSLASASVAFAEHGAEPLHDAVRTPWEHHNQRLQTADGAQITLYQVLPAPEEARNE